MLSSSVAEGQSSPTTMALVDMQTSKAGVRPIVQRKAGTTAADVPVLFTYTGAAPSRPEARVVRYAGGAVVRDWAPLTSLSASGGSGAGRLAGVPQGIDYLLQLRDGLQPENSATRSDGVVPWGVGVVFLFQGQSNMISTLTGRYLDTVPGSSPARDEYAYFNAGLINGAVFDSAGWHAPSNGSNGPSGSTPTATGNVIAFMRIVAARVQALYGYPVPVGIIPHAYNATGIGAFQPGGNYYNELFGRSGATVGAIGLASPGNVYAGDFEGVMYHQGEANVADTTAVYSDKLRVLYEGYLAYVAQFGRTANHLLFGPAVIGTMSSTNIESIRNAYAHFESYAKGRGWNRVQVGWMTTDLALTDGLHFGGAAEQRRSMRRAIQTVLKYMGAATFSGRGPQLSPVAARAGDVVTLSVVHEGGSALATANAGAPAGFYVNAAADFSGADITPAVTLANGNTQIQLTMPGGTAYPVYVKYLGARIGTITSAQPDISNPVYDNVQYPTGATSTDVEALGLPLLPTFAAIRVD